MCRPGDAYQLIVCRGFAAVLAASDLRQNRAPRTASRFRDLSVSIRTSRCRPGVTPQRPEYEGPAQQEQRGTDGEAVEGYSRLMASRGVHLTVGQQRGWPWGVPRYLGPPAVCISAWHNSAAAASGIAPRYPTSAHDGTGTATRRTRS